MTSQFTNLEVRIFPIFFSLRKTLTMQGQLSWSRITVQQRLFLMRQMKLFTTIKVEKTRHFGVTMNRVKKQICIRLKMLTQRQIWQPQQLRRMWILEGQIIVITRFCTEQMPNPEHWKKNYCLEIFLTKSLADRTSIREKKSKTFWHTLELSAMQQMTQLQKEL